MPYSSGSYSFVVNSWNPAVAATNISAADWNAQATDLATALSTCMLKDGTQTATALVPFAQGIRVGVAGSVLGFVDYAGNTSGTTRLAASAIASGTLTLPAATDTLVGKATTDTLTNKTLTSPILTTPQLGTPASGTLTNCTGLPISTGVAGLGSNVATFLATPSSANLAAALTDETGSGPAVFATTPSFTTTIGVGGATASASGSGVSFPATQSASTDANTLDDYEEGSWTPVIIGLATAGTQTYSRQNGRYTKIGDTVIAWFDITMTALDGASAGNSAIGGLPFTVGNGSVYVAGNGLAQIGAVDFSAGYSFIGMRPEIGTTTARFLQSGDNIAVSLLPVTQIGATATFIGCVIYKL